MYNFSNEQIERYSRHIILKEVGGMGQTKLLESKVLLIGAGGLGSPAGLYLAAAGVGTLGIVDDDVVDMSNLQRQILHGTSDIGRPKTESAKDTIADINPDVNVITHPEKIVSENAFEILEGYAIQKSLFEYSSFSARPAPAVFILFIDFNCHDSVFNFKFGIGTDIGIPVIIVVGF